MWSPLRQRPSVSAKTNGVLGRWGGVLAVRFSLALPCDAVPDAALRETRSCRQPMPMPLSAPSPSSFDHDSGGHLDRPRARTLDVGREVAKLGAQRPFRIREGKTQLRCRAADA
jgi:hypothetical protein